MKDLNTQIQGKFNARRDFLPFIDEIRFPYYKALEPNLTVRFSWPIVAIVGPNGTNKSSVLQAIASAPQGKSLAPFWFSTKVDDIDERTVKSRDAGGTGQQRFIYKYTFELNAPQAECRKSRVSKQYRGDGVPKPLRGLNDPDYWEPTKRVAVDKMEPLPEAGYNTRLSERRDRWNLIDKRVKYLDFRTELSAFDKFIHHQGFDQWVRDENQKRYRVVQRSEGLARALDGKRLRKDQQSRIIAPLKTLDSKATEHIAVILGKPIEHVSIVEHRFYGPSGATIKFRLKGAEDGRTLEYSEAHAGSGEYAVVRLVDALESAKQRSLILLDEPEVSLHPGAQIALMKYIKQKVLAEGHQVVISTHSPTIVAQLPDEAIKVLGLNPSTHQVRMIADGCSSTEAFMHLGHVMDPGSKPRLIVEDELAAEIVRTALRHHEPGVLDSIEIVPFSGGAGGMVKKLLGPMAATQVKNVAILLDGDQLPINSPLRKSRSGISERFKTVSSKMKILELWKEAFHESVPELFLDNRDDDDAYAEKLRNCGLWASRSLGYLPGRTPEELLFLIEGGHESRSGLNWKEYWVKETRLKMRLTKSERPKSADILHVQRAALLYAEDPDSLLKEIAEIVKEIIPLSSD